MVRTREQLAMRSGTEVTRTTAPQEQEQDAEPKTLLELCDEALRARAATRSREVLEILSLARFTHREALEDACVRAIWRNFAVLRERHDPEELRAALGDERFEKFDTEINEFQECKLEAARLRSGQVVDLRPCADAQADERGNFPLSALRSGAAWPEGVDPANREMRLHDDIFQELFKMGKEEFAKLPKYVRIREKKAHDLF